MVARQWDVLSQETRKELVEELVTLLEADYEVTIGVIAADALIDAVLQRAGGDIYNAAIEDARAALRNSLDTMDVNLSALRRNT